MNDWLFRFCRWRIRRLMRRIDWWEWLAGERRPQKRKAPRNVMCGNDD